MCRARFCNPRLIAWFTDSITPSIGGVPADFVMEPAMQTGTSHLAYIFTGRVGRGLGSGMSLEFIFGGFLVALTSMTGYFIPSIRIVETLPPDDDQPAV